MGGRRAGKAALWGAGLLGVSACFTIVSVLCFRFSMLRMGGRRAGKAALWGAGLLGVSACFTIVSVLCFRFSMLRMGGRRVGKAALCGAGLLGVSACFTIISVLCFRVSMLRMGGRRAGKAALWGAGLLTGAGLIKSQLDNQKVSATRANNCQSSGLKFPSKENYPDLTNHNNVMASHLTPEVGDNIMQYIIRSI